MLQALVQPICGGLLLLHEVGFWPNLDLNGRRLEQVAVAYVHAYSNIQQLRVSQVEMLESHGGIRLGSANRRVAQGPQE